MAVSYSLTNKRITVTGYSEATPCTLSDIHTADLGGTLTLLDGTIDADPDTFSLDDQIQPAEELAQKLTIACTARGGATCDISGTDAWDNAISETGIDISSGSATTTKYFKTVDANGITVNGLSVDDDFDITQGRWGACWKLADQVYKIEEQLYIGDGSTATYFKDIRKALILKGSWATAALPLHIQEAAQAQFGLKNADGYGYYGCHLIFDCSTSNEWYLQITNNTGKLYAYQTYFQDLRSGGGTGGRFFPKTSTSIDLADCVIERFRGLRTYTSMTVNRVKYLYGNSGLNCLTGVSLTALEVLYCYNNFLSVQKSDRTFTFTDIVMQGTPSIYHFFFAAKSNQTCDLINSNNTNLTIYDYGTNSTLNYKFHFDLKVVDSGGNGISGATVTMDDKDGTESFSVSTDANGDIAQQTVNYKQYTKAGGAVTLSPHTLTISKAGYIKKEVIYTMDRKREEIEMLEKVRDLNFSKHAKIHTQP